MRLSLACSIGLSLPLLVVPVANASTTTSGRVTDEQSGANLGGTRVGILRKSTVDSAPHGVSLEPELITPVDVAGQYQFSIDDTDPTFDEFYVFTLAVQHFNETHDDVFTTFARPFRSDFDQAGVVVLDGRVDNPSVDFQLESNRITVAVPMRDGQTNLAMDVYLASPTGAAAPTVLERTPYNKSDLYYRLDYTSHGYNVAIQDMRGRFASDGDDNFFRDEAWGTHQDGYDTIEWVAAQSYSDGNVGMIGASAPAMVQYLAAGSAPPSLKCCYALVGTGDMYGGVTFTGGVLRKHMMEEWLKLQGNEDYIPTLEQHPNRDAWWDELNVSTRLDQVNVPFLHLGGWFDIMSESALTSYQDFQYRAGAGAVGNQKLVIGPWSHWNMFQRGQGELTFPGNAAWNSSNTLQLELAFFDHWLKSVDSGFYDEKPVRYYLMGDVDDPAAPGNRWRKASTWPPPKARDVRYYLGANGSLAPKADVTTAERAFGGTEVSWVFDPDSPAPTVGGSNLWLPQGPYDQQSVEARADAVTFSTEPLDQPVTVSGNLSARLFVSSTARDTDFVVKISDVYPDGRSMLIQENIIRARHRISDRREDLLVPGQRYVLDIDLWSTAIVFNTGHRIRMTVTSSSDPRWDVNPNTGDPFRANDDTEVATNTLYCAQPAASFLTLPIIR